MHTLATQQKHAMQLNEIVPWGRSLDEYRRMFALQPADLSRTMLGCGDGPASFNAEATALGYRIVSCDPIYVFTADEIAARVQTCYDTIIEQVRHDSSRYLWNLFRDADELGRHRLATMNSFLADYEHGRSAGRYVAAALPALPFADGAFDLCFCSHLLVLYSDQLDLDFHLSAAHELLRVARQVRIFPVVDLDCRPSRHVDPLSSHLQAVGYQVDVQMVPYEFQRGGNQMMSISRAARDA